MAPSSKETSRSSSSKKDSKDKDKDRSSRHQTTGASSSKPSRKAIPEEDEYAESSSRKILGSEFFKDETVAPPPRIPESHRVKDSKPSKHDSNYKQPSTSRSHHGPSKSTHQDRPSKPVLRYEDRSEKEKKEEKKREASKVKFKTAFTDPKDVDMAEKQTRLKTLKPAELEKQHKWAQEKLQIHGVCPAGFKWWEYTGLDQDDKPVEGYRCFAGGHFISHQLLAEAKGGFYTMHIPGLLYRQLVAAQIGQPNFGLSGPSGSNMMPNYPTGFNSMMPGSGGVPGVSPFGAAPMAQPVPQVPAARPSKNPPTPGSLIWHGPQYPPPDHKERRAAAIAIKAKMYPGWAKANAALDGKPIPDEFQQGKPIWLLRGD